MADAQQDAQPGAEETQAPETAPPPQPEPEPTAPDAQSDPADAGAPEPDAPALADEPPADGDAPDAPDAADATAPADDAPAAEASEPGGPAEPSEAAETEPSEPAPGPQAADDLPADDLPAAEPGSDPEAAGDAPFLDDPDGLSAEDGPTPDLTAAEPPLEAPASGFAERFQPIADLIDAGGPIIVILAALSVVTLAVVLVKLIQFAWLRVGDRGFIDPAVAQMRDGDAEGALAFLQERRSVVARVMEAAVRGFVMNAEEARVREEVTRVAQTKLDGLERGVPLLSLIATLSPLLGLLGTVLGMIEAFQQLEDAGDRVDPAILSGGIWEALLTTAAGLSVAIPAAAFYTWLQRAVDVAAQRMEDAATQVFTATLYARAPAPAPLAPSPMDQAAE